MKKLLAFIISFTIVFTLSAPFCHAQEDEKLNYLLLGDSIAQGYGVKNRDEASFGKIVADTNGYNYENLARTATDTSDWLAYLERDYVIKAVEKADIISLSVGSNDYLASSDVVLLGAQSLFGYTGEIKAREENIYENFSKIIPRIYKINPDVTLLVNNVYVAWRFIGKKIFTDATTCVNDVYDRYLEKHPGAFYLVDFASALNDRPDYIADDCVHPNAKGNIALAKVTLEKLKEIGVGENTEPVVLVEGIDYNFYIETYGKALGMFLTILIKTLTGNLFDYYPFPI
ncbi:MAG: SGNH/GDSL hydrolase family protein [Clostridia bacterium]|nr:SGNH/GDSL hydrolase family protein [Clostridia bacterium]